MKSPYCESSLLVYLLWDASAATKRYTPEVGSEVVDALFTSSGTVSVITVPGYAEIFSILLRKYNAGIIQETTRAIQLSKIRLE